MKIIIFGTLCGALPNVRSHSYQQTAVKITTNSYYRRRSVDNHGRWHTYPLASSWSFEPRSWHNCLYASLLSERFSIRLPLTQA